MRDFMLSLVILALLLSIPALALAAGERILVTNTRDGALSVISRDTHEVIKTIPAGRKANRLSLAPDGRHAYLINDGSAFRARFRHAYAQIHPPRARRARPLQPGVLAQTARAPIS